MEGKRRGIGRRGLLIGASGVLAAPAVVRAEGQNGVALVIGNSKYQWEAQLPNVRRDAPDIARAFQALGLKTDLVQDAGRDAMLRAIDKFTSASRGANLASFYFAGHGATWENHTYLVPVDADLSDPSAVKSLVPADSIAAATKDAAHGLQVYDNCRNNPADGWRQLAAVRGAIVIEERVPHIANVLVLFSTAPGRVALDGPAGQNSPFAASFLRQLSRPSIDLQSMSSKLRRDLLIATEGQQVLWDRNGFDQPFVLTGLGKGIAPAASGDPSRIVELPNAYAYAQKNNLPLPSGLVAHRTAANSPYSQMIGAFEFTNKSPVGPSPYLFIVLSVDEQGTAQVIISLQNDAGRLWRFVTGSVSGKRLSYVPNSGRPTTLIDWSDANSGSVGALQGDNIKANTNGRNTVRSTPFKRLDG